MSGDLWLSALVSVLIAAGGVGGTMYATRSARAQAVVAQRSADQNAGHDQVQEDLAALRLEFNQEKTDRRIEREKDQREIRYQAGIIRSLDGEIVDLRRGIVAHDPTYILPDRKPWPPYPGEWVESP